MSEPNRPTSSGLAMLTVHLLAIPLVLLAGWGLDRLGMREKPRPIEVVQPSPAPPPRERAPAPTPAE